MPADEGDHVADVSHELGLADHVVVGRKHHDHRVGVALPDDVGGPQNGRRRAPVFGLEQALRRFAARELLGHILDVPHVSHHDDARDRNLRSDAVQRLAQERAPSQQRGELLRSIVAADVPGEGAEPPSLAPRQHDRPRRLRLAVAIVDGRAGPYVGCPCRHHPRPAGILEGLTAPARSPT